ncbi:MAG: tetratricopeptide repeat protein, partial [Parabacteroides sp.]|nr:tetratricopeptide repeat protein [Parabacteroides sp.]
RQKEFEAFEITLFNKIWTSGFLTQEEVGQIKAMLANDDLPITSTCQIISALMLGLQEFFDKEKLMLLFDAANDPEEEIKIRAYISILLTLYLYRKRMALYPQIANRLAALAEAPNFSKTIRTITLQFIIARETEKITRKLQEEIIPEMMKLSPKISSKINLKDITPDQLEEGMNPEWENILSDSKLGKKIEEFNELQLEGADVMHSTFIHLKNFPFFRELSNWFLPFNVYHSSFNNRFDQSDSAEKQILSTMSLASFMCSSDRYSLYFSMMQLPAEAQKMMMNQFDAQSTELIQQNKDKLINQRGKENIIISQYIQDLYRFFKLYPSHLDFTDIFTLPLDFHNLEILRPYISDQESLTMIAECYLRKNYYRDALTIFEQLAEQEFDSEIIFQKIGYCKQMEGNIEGALSDYLHADLLNPDSKWVIKHIASCYRTLKKPQEALTYYRRYEALNPDNLSIQISIGNCHLELKDYNEALKCFFKVDYLDPKSHKAWRPIAWCSFLTGKYDQARNYYKKILDHKPNAQDFLNAGHTEWTLQNIKGALAYYQQVVQKEEGEFTKFLELFNQDIPDLLVAGIEQSEITLMLDQLRYKIAGDL